MRRRTVGQALAQPHKTETFKLSTDPAFVDKVRDVAGLSMAPPHRGAVRR